MDLVWLTWEQNGLGRLLKTLETTSWGRKCGNVERYGGGRVGCALNLINLWVSSQARKGSRIWSTPHPERTTPCRGRVKCTSLSQFGNHNKRHIQHFISRAPKKNWHSIHQQPPTSFRLFPIPQKHTPHKNYVHRQRNWNHARSSRFPQTIQCSSSAWFKIIDETIKKS